MCKQKNKFSFSSFSSSFSSSFFSSLFSSLFSAFPFAKVIMNLLLITLFTSWAISFTQTYAESLAKYQYQDPNAEALPVAAVPAAEEGEGVAEEVKSTDENIHDANINKDPNKSIFSLINSRYKQTAYPRLLRK